MNENNFVFCSKCGSRVDITDKFCTVCGLPQNPVVPQQEVADQEPVQETTTVAQQPVNNEIPQETPAQQEIPQEVPQTIPAQQEIPQPAPVQQETPQPVPVQQGIPQPAPVQPVQMYSQPVYQPPKEKKPFPKWLFAVLGVAVAAVVGVVVVLNVVCFHEWQPATCLSPETCIECGETRGTTADHDWSKATCEKPKTCRVCGDTTGEPIAHTPGAEETETDYITAKKYTRVNCTECGAMIEEDSTGITKLYNDSGFCFTPLTFTERYKAQLGRVPGHSLTASCTSLGDLVVCSIENNGRVVGNIAFFINEEETLSPGEENGTGIKTIFLNGEEGSTTEDFTTMYIALLYTCDPTIDSSEASANVRNIFSDGASKNGIFYLGDIDEGEFHMMATLD